VKYLIRAMRMSDACALAEEVLALESAPAIHARCEAFYRARVRLE
jgi:phosphotransferase system enzyme I (PtsI)